MRGMTPFHFLSNVFVETLTLLGITLLETNSIQLYNEETSISKRRDSNAFCPHFYSCRGQPLTAPMTRRPH